MAFSRDHENKEIAVAVIEVLRHIGAALYFLVNAVIVILYYSYCTIIAFNIQCIVSDLQQRAVALGDAIRVPDFPLTFYQFPFSFVVFLSSSFFKIRVNHAGKKLPSNITL